MASLGFLGALQGGAQAAQGASNMVFQDYMQTRRADAERAARIAEYQQKRADTLTDADRERKYKQEDDAASDARQHKYKLAEIKAKADADSKGSDGTNSFKEMQELLGQGVPESAARGIAYGTFKSVTDPSTGSVVVIDTASNGKEVGRMVPADPQNPMSPRVWMAAGADDQRPLSNSERRSAAKTLNKETGRDNDWIPFNEYSPDAPEVEDRAREGRKGLLSQGQTAPAAPAAPVTPSAPAPAAPAPAAKAPPKPETAKAIKPVYTHPSGKKVTREQIEQTARNRGMSTDEVIRQLGLQ